MTEEVATIPVDVLTEQAVLATAMLDEGARDRLIQQLRADTFQVPQHRAQWVAIVEAHRRKLSCSPDVLHSLGGQQVEIQYLRELVQVHPVAMQVNDLDHHVDLIIWNHKRATAAKGPLKLLLQALQDPRTDPVRIQQLSKQTADCFVHQGRNLLIDPHALVEQQMQKIRDRSVGKAFYPFGLQGLDYYEPDEWGVRKRRLIDGAAPGKVTVVTGVSSSGKSALTRVLAMGLARQRRRVLMGAWEVDGGETLELMACLSLDWPRTKLIPMEERLPGIEYPPLLTPEEDVLLYERMQAISQWIQFMELPAKRQVGQTQKVDNFAVMDVIQRNISDSGAEVFIADLWKRALRNPKPEEEEEALIMQQAMAQEMGVHCILVQQQRLKDVEQRADKRPSREGVKGSSGYIEVGDTVFGVHRPAMFKAIDDDQIEVLLMKQRGGESMMGVAFDWRGAYGSFRGGRSITYRPGGGEDQGGSDVGDFPINRGKKR